MIPLKAPPGVSTSTIEGTEYEADRDGIVHARSEAHARILRVHGFTTPVSDQPVPTPVPAPVAASEPAPYMTGPYKRHIAWLRQFGVEVADDAADSVVLRLTEELHETAAKNQAARDVKEGAKTASPPEADKPGKRPNFDGMKAADLDAWLKAADVTVPEDMPRAEKIQIAKARWEELNPEKGD